MNTKYGSISNNVVENGLEQYIGKFFKILPMYEEKCPTLTQYIESLSREMIGFTNLGLDEANHHDFLVLIVTLTSLLKDNITNEEVRSDVFKSINILKKVKSRVM
jgi:hypothetical protein